MFRESLEMKKFGEIRRGKAGEHKKDTHLGENGHN